MTSGIIPLPELDLFGLPPIQQAIKRDYVTEHRPISVLSSSSSVEFNIPSGKDEYIKLNETEVYIKLRVKTSAPVIGDIPSNFDKVGVVNNTLNSLFSNIRISIGNREVTFNSINHPYRAYIESLLGFTDTAKKTHLAVAGWSYDGKEANGSNLGFEARNKLRQVTGIPRNGHVTYELVGKLFTDISNQQRALIGGTQLKIEFLPSKPEFVILHDSSLPDTVTSSYEFEEFNLLVHRAQVTDFITEAHDIALEKSNSAARYPISHSEVKSFVIPSNVLEWSNDNVCIGALPRRMLVATVPSDSFSGRLKSNPFKFDHNNVNHVATYVNGVPYPLRPLSPNYNRNQFSKEYLGLLENLNLDVPSNDIGITRDMFKEGYNIYAFNYSPDLSDGVAHFGHVSEKNTGTLRLQIKFSTPTSQNLNVICFLEFDNMLFIDKNRVGYTDFNTFA